MPRIHCQICSRACLPLRPGGAGINQSMKGGVISEGVMGVCAHHMCFYTSICVGVHLFSGFAVFAETVCQVTHS